MKNPKVIQLSRNERIVAVVPERASGPGWANHMTWVYIVNYATNKWRSEVIGVEERSDALRHLWELGETVSAALLAAVPHERKT